MTCFPKDPAMLLSWTNMKLRDFYPDMESLCEDLCIDQDEIFGLLSQGGYEYDREHNKFI